MPSFQTDTFLTKKNVPQPWGGALLEVPIDYTFAAAQAALASGDLIELVRDLPPGVKIVDFYIVAQQLDSNGVPTLAFSLGAENAGRTDLATTYEASLTIGRTANGNVTRSTTSVPTFNADFSTSRNIALKCTTTAATWAGAGKSLKVVLLLQGF